ncbi:hypothetical protein [Azospirillum sp. TSO22-1]|uniref:hypothetical protein n=1 Tax=Azospirillum sp. TSO22-1 TaxID=716789 RepID=UPI000D61BF60|nr:hypothetical protein [Azospirillum sp. TSO22-1]PWC42407.1 hypothetical protein TSO221_21805 [Azospirillum sp. TSO22-1]
MIRPFLLPAAALLLTAGSAAAQDMGGIGFAPGGPSAANLAQAFAQPARLPVFANPQKRGAPPGAMVTNPAVSRSSMHQQSITKIRGDAGLLAGFDKGQALAPSRQPPPPQIVPNFTFIDAPFIVNNVNSALNFTVGDGNVSEQGMAQAQTGTPSVPTPPPAPTAVQQPKVPTGPKPDPLMSNLGPLPHLPYAMQNGGVTFNNVNSATNMAVGVGNTAVQKVRMVQK